MRRRRKSEHDRQAMALAAARYAAQGMLQEDIAARLDVTQPEISRLLRIAKDAKWLQTTPTVVRHIVPDDLWDRTENDYFSAPGDLEEKINEWAPKSCPVRVKVVAVADRESFGYAAAQHVTSILDNTETLGIMWGHALADLNAGLVQTLSLPTGPRPTRLRVFPICGEPFYADDSSTAEISSSRLAQELQKAVNGPRSASLPCPSLFGIPAYIPRFFDDDDRKVLDRYLDLHPGYREIYGYDRKKGLIHHVDTIITGVGALSADDLEGKRTGVFLSERLEHEDIAPGELDRLVHGDFGGVLIPRNNLSRSQTATVEGLNRGWTGANLEQLKRCARKAAKARSRTGVVVVAEGAAKAWTIREIVRLGAVNELLLGQELGSALDELSLAG